MKARLCRNKPGIVAPFATRGSPYVAIQRSSEQDVWICTVFA
jgi:hypothetical protein